MPLDRERETTSYCLLFVKTRSWPSAGQLSHPVRKKIEKLSLPKIKETKYPNKEKEKQLNHNRNKRRIKRKKMLERENPDTDTNI